MTWLLDVNVLIALIDGAHVSHEVAHKWFAREGRERWATCPITQNGLVRIVGNPKYPNSAGTPGEAIALLQKLVALPGHVFWPDDVSLARSDLIDAARILTVGQVTDSYLLALAISKGGKLATLDRRLSSAAVKGGAAGLKIIGAGD